MRWSGLPPHAKRGRGSIHSLAPKLAWRDAGIPAVCPGERTRFAKADPSADQCHRKRRLQQQALGSRHPPGHVVATRRQAEGTPESSRKMVRAEPRKPCERDKRNLVGEMLFDKLNDQSLLPRGQATSKRRGRNSERFFGSDVFMHGDAGSKHRLKRPGPIRSRYCNRNAERKKRRWVT